MDSCQGYTSNLDPLSVTTHRKAPQEALPCTSVRACVRACAEVFQAVAVDINLFLYLAVYAYCACSCTVNYIIIVYGTKKIPELR